MGLRIPRTVVVVGIAGLLALAPAPASRAEGETNQARRLWFPVGEELVYHIYWGVVPIGESVVTTEWAEYRGKKYLAIRFRTRTNKVMERIYPVDDLIEVLIHPDTFLPERFTKKLSEGRYRCHEVTTFNHRDGVAHWRSKLKDRQKEYEIEPDTRDIVTFMYFARCVSFELGDEKTFRVMADEKLYDVEVKVVKKEDVKTGDGKKVSSLKLEPKASFEGLFVRKGKMWLWISEGERCVVTKMAAKVPVASVKLILEEVRSKGDDFWSEPIEEPDEREADEKDDEDPTSPRLRRASEEE